MFNVLANGNARLSISSLQAISTAMIAFCLSSIMSSLSSSCLVVASVLYCVALSYKAQGTSAPKLLTHPLLLTAARGAAATAAGAAASGAAAVSGAA